MQPEEQTTQTRSIKTMAVVRIIRKEKNFTMISNIPLQDKRLSLKARGLMAYMLSLPDGWKYSVKGIAANIKEGMYTVTTVLKELREYGYVEMIRIDPNLETKRYTWQYNIYEEPIINPADQPDIDEIEEETEQEPAEEKPKKTPKKKKQPTIEEIKQYCDEKGYSVDAETFFNYYAANEWKDGNGKPVESWKAKIVMWNNNSKKQLSETNNNASEQRKHNKMPDIINPYKDTAYKHKEVPKLTISEQPESSPDHTDNKGIGFEDIPLMEDTFFL